MVSTTGPRDKQTVVGVRSKRWWAACTRDAVSRPIYEAGRQLGNRIRETGRDITGADLAELLAVAHRKPSCLPCLLPATREEKNFSGRKWSW